MGPEPDRLGDLEIGYASGKIVSSKLSDVERGEISQSGHDSSAQYFSKIRLAEDNFTGGDGDRE